MIMDGMLSNISQRLHEVNTLLATYGQGVLSFEQVLPPSLFYQDQRNKYKDCSAMLLKAQEILQGLGELRTGGNM